MRCLANARRMAAMASETRRNQRKAPPAHLLAGAVRRDRRAAGQRPSRVARPVGPTDEELELVRLAAAIKKENPGWSRDACYAEARHRLVFESGR